jgi:membrane peptidoglycan carboxypeptidase
VQTTVRRAGALAGGTIPRLVLTTLVAALLLAATALPFVGITGIAVRDAANTFDTLQVGKLGAAPSSSVLYDTEGKPIAYFYPFDVYRVPVGYNQIAPVMRNAIVAIEDDTFFSQGALDPRGTLRALVSTGSGSQLQGASTLAQQYVKNVKVLQGGLTAAGNPTVAAQQAAAPNLQRKIQQLRLAVVVEHELTPDQLLTSYLNVAYFDNHAYGIQVAAETYFSKSASELTLPEAAMLAGIVQSPSAYDPLRYQAAALHRRSQVLTRMWQLHYVPKSVALAAESSPLGLKPSNKPQNIGCESPSVANSAFFCDYVEHVLKLDYPSVWSDMQDSGGLAIHTTLNMKDQLAADRAVNYVEPPHNAAVNPNRNADTEVLLQPGTGDVRAIAVNRTYGSGPGEDDIDYAVNLQYGGDPDGVQTGSSSKIFTLITALKQNYPFGHTIKIENPESYPPFPTCDGRYAVTPAPVFNAEAPFKGSETWQLNEATVQSVNNYFYNLENQVGLCNVVKTAVDMGMTRADGTSLMKYDHALGPSNGLPAYNYTSFTLGSVGVSPMSMAAAYASVAARGMYCSPDAITGIEVAATHKQLPVRPASCHRDMSRGVADAANYILQGVLDQPGGTAANRDIPGLHVAGKTGTANDGYFAAFAGYTPTLASYTSVFNPVDPTKDVMVGYPGSCYRDLTGPECPGQMYGDNAPAATWEYTFLRAQLGPNVPFVNPPASYFSEGDGLGSPTTTGPKKGKGGPGNGGGPGHGGAPPTPAH